MIRHFNFMVRIFVAIFFLSALSATAITQNAKHSGLFSVKLGYAGPGNVVSHGTQHFRIDAAFSAGMALDFPIFKRNLLTGVAADLYKIKRQWSSSYDGDEWLLNLLWDIKGNIGSRSRNLTFGPGFGIGYGIYGHRFFQTSPNSPFQFLIMQATTEIIVGARNRTAFLMEVGFLFAPDGGNEYVHYEIGPTPLIRLGLQFP